MPRHTFPRVVHRRYRRRVLEEHIGDPVQHLPKALLHLLIRLCRPWRLRRLRTRSFGRGRLPRSRLRARSEAVGGEKFLVLLFRYGVGAQVVGHDSRELIAKLSFSNRVGGGVVRASQRNVQLAGHVQQLIQAFPEGDSRDFPHSFWIFHVDSPSRRVTCGGPGTAGHMRGLRRRSRRKFGDTEAAAKAGAGSAAAPARR
eukprot:scaffold1583_cov299-Pinguiococcus_pyrenoidosus.AAC.16